MATEWRVKGTELVTCNCAYGCPCQFNALPTHGNCRGAAAWRFEEGQFDDVRLDGLNAVVLFSFPGAIHEGNGTLQYVIDERADNRQREALTKILTGEDTEPMATVWWVVSQMSPNKLETVFAPIEYEVDIDGRRGRFHVPDLVESKAEPIRNPVTGAEHRVRIDLPDGFEYRLAEIGSATTKTSGPIQVPDVVNAYAQLAHIHLSNRGIVA